MMLIFTLLPFINFTFFWPAAFAIYFLDSHSQYNSIRSLSPHCPGTHLLPDYAGGLHGLGDVAGRGRGEVEAVVEVIELVRRAAVHVVRPGRR